MGPDEASPSSQPADAAEHAQPSSTAPALATAAPAAPNANSGVSAPAANAPAMIREDHVENAVAFLSHPKVRSSSATSKRSFLERKGLTAEEIDEAFRRVPESTAPAAAATPTAAPAPLAAPAAPQAPLQATLQHLQPSAPFAGQAPQQAGLVMAHPGMQQMVPAPQQPPLRWSQVALGAGFFAAGTYAVKQLLWPYVWEAYEGWRERQGGARVRPPPRPKDANGELSLEASRAVAEAIQAQTAELRSSIGAIRELAEALEEQRRRGEEEAVARAEAAAAGAGVVKPPESVTVAELRQELKALASTLQESIAASPAKSAGASGEPASMERELSEIKGLLAAFLRSPDTSRTTTGAAAALDFGSPLSTRSDAASGAAPTPAEARGEPRMISAFAQPAAASAEGGAASSGKEAVVRADGQLARPDSATSLASSAPSQPPHPPSYMEVLEMLEKGITPPGIRTDIDDKAPNPEQPPPQPRMRPRPKPWERKGAATGSAIPGSSGVSTPSAASAPAASHPFALVDSLGGRRGVVRSASGSSLASSQGGQPGAAAAGAAAPAAAAARPAAAEEGPPGTAAVAAAAGAASQARQTGTLLEAAAATPDSSSSHAAQGGSDVQAQVAAHVGTAAEEEGGVGPAHEQAGKQVPGMGGHEAGTPVPSPQAAGGSYRDAVLGGGGGGAALEAAAPPSSSPSAPAEAAGSGGMALTAHRGVFRSPRPRALSIFEAAAAAPSSPGMIAGRFSPFPSPGASPQPSLRDASGLAALGDAPPTHSLPADGPRGQQQQAAATGKLAPPYTQQPTATQEALQPTPALFGEPAAATLGPELSTPVPPGAAAGSAGAAGASPESVDRTSGSGIARPLSSGWRPPPIPVPTLLGSAGKGERGSGSDQSLGADFSSAV